MCVREREVVCVCVCERERERFCVRSVFHVPKYLSKVLILNNST